MMYDFINDFGGESSWLEADDTTEQTTIKVIETEEDWSKYKA